MTTRTNVFEGQVSGTAWTIANSGGGSGDAFSALTNSGTVTAEYRSAQAAHGTNSLYLNASATSQYIVRWTGLAGGSIALRVYVRLVGSSTAQDLIQIRNASAQAAAVGLSSTNQIQVKNAAGTTVKTFTALSLNTWYRFEIELTKGTTTSNGTINARYYSGDSTTVVEAAYASGAAVNSGTADYTETRIGKQTSAPTLEMYYDSVSVNDATGSPVGPFLWTDAVSELVTVDESTAAVVVTTGTATEGATVVESTIDSTVTIGTATELVTAAESAAGLTVTIGSAAESFTVAESTVSSTVAGGSATGSESIALAESAAGLTISTGTVTETVTVTESAAGQTTTLGAATEPITVAETAAALTVTTGTADETITLLEAAAAGTVFAVTLVETITLAESIAIAHDLDLAISIGTPRSTAGMFVGAPQISADVVGSPRTTTPVTIGRGV